MPEGHGWRDLYSTRAADTGTELWNGPIYFFHINGFVSIIKWLLQFSGNILNVKKQMSASFINSPAVLFLISFTLLPISTN